MLGYTYNVGMVFTGLAVVFFYAAQAQVLPLQQCIDTAMLYNKNLQIQRNHVDISNQKREEIKGNLLPKVSVNADYKYFTNLPYQLMPMSVFGGPQRNSVWRTT